MNEQLALFETPEPAPVRLRFFLGLLPPAEIRQQIWEAANTLRTKHGLRGKLRPLDHFHISLHHLGDYSHEPENLAGRADQACLSVTERMTPFEVTFNRVFSFQGRPGNRPVVLFGSAQNEALEKLHGALSGELTKAGFRVGGSAGFFPHLTLLYDGQVLPEEAFGPVSWTVEEIVLVRSHLGLTKYDEMNCWTLGG